ncbi:hypothetical protein AVEN_154165-1 [Araneus ventricosus]|uniref:Uncharacterized protein n=1 Tax=Araneus ventricosus TaxID=182803 RepID=A0A4Y2GHJ4_ARAVE|nr:hypothetical protein AVEN_154165-1 [Araneus ventricosus]
MQENDFIPNVHRKFSATDVRESNSKLQHAETAENSPSQVPDELQGPLLHQQCHQLMFRHRSYHRSDVQPDSFSMSSSPVPTSQSQIPRRSGRIRRLPKRLDL